LPNGGPNAYLSKPFELESLEEILLELDVTVTAPSGA
jgi:hypothetical protein